HKISEAMLKAHELERERMISEFTARAAEAYKKILTRYPVMVRSDDAKARLIALHQEVPRPTKAMLAQNKAEEDARKQQGMMSSLMGAFSRHPNTSGATKAGDPTLQDKEPLSASGMVQEAARALAAPKSSGTESVSVKTTGTRVPGENQPAPRSDTPAADATSTDGSTAARASQPEANELKPEEAAADPPAPDPNELKPNVAENQPAPAPPQHNEIQGDSPQASAKGQGASGQELADDEMIASSKHKKKKGFRKIIPGR